MSFSSWLSHPSLVEGRALETPYNDLLIMMQNSGAGHLHYAVTAAESVFVSIRSAVFTARLYASAVYAVVVCPSVCPSVRFPVASRHCNKMAKRRITKTTSYDSTGRQRSRRNSDRVTSNGCAK